MSPILEHGHRNPIDILVERFNWDYDVVSLCLTWALGEDWIEQKVKDFWWKWNERNADKQKMALTAKTDPEKAIIAIGLLFKQKIALEQLALRKGAKFGKRCTCHSGRNFEKCCGDLLEFYKPELYKGPPTSKAKLVSGSKRIVEGTGPLVKPKKKGKAFGWFKGPRSVEQHFQERTGQ